MSNKSLRVNKPRQKKRVEELYQILFMFIPQNYEYTVQCAEYIHYDLAINIPKEHVIRLVSRLFLVSWVYPDPRDVNIVGL